MLNVQMYECIFERKNESHLGWRILILVISTLFFLLTSSLLLFHTYLAIANLTTCNPLMYDKLIFKGKPGAGIKSPT